MPSSFKELLKVAKDSLRRASLFKEYIMEVVRDRDRYSRRVLSAIFGFILLSIALLILDPRVLVFCA